MPARLVPLIPDGPPPISLSRPVLLVGRHPECDVRIDRPQISRRHCCLAIIDQHVVLRDLGSRHGCWLNGRRIDEAHLELGDEIAIGHLIYRLDEGLPPLAESGIGFAPVDATPPPFAPTDPLPRRNKSVPVPLPASPAPPPPPTPAPAAAASDDRLPVDFDGLDLGDLFKLRDE